MDEIKKYWWVALVLGAFMFFTVGKRNKYKKKRYTGYRATRLAIANLRYGWKKTRGTKGLRNRIRHIRSGQY